MNIWFIIMLFMHAINIGVELARHGEERTGTHNAFTQLIGSGIGIFLLYNAVRVGF